jgi:hypothetical protein
MAMMLPTVAVAAAAVYSPRLTPFIISSSRNAVTLYSQVEGAFTGEMTAALKQGTSLRFDFEIRVIRERPFLPDLTHASAVLSRDGRFDPVKQQYLFTETWNGREIRRTTSELDDLEKWMKDLDGLEIVSREGLRADRRYYVEVRLVVAMAGDFFKRNIFFFSSGDKHATGWFRSPLFAISEVKRP